MASRQTPADVLAQLKPAAEQVRQATQAAAQVHYQQPPTPAPAPAAS